MTNEEMLKATSGRDTDDNEYQAILNMLKRANAEGLIVEVVQKFGEFRSSGDDLVEACRCACYEWDL